MAMKKCKSKEFENEIENMERMDSYQVKKSREEENNQIKMKM